MLSHPTSAHAPAHRLPLLVKPAQALSAVAWRGRPRPRTEPGQPRRCHGRPAVRPPSLPSRACLGDTKAHCPGYCPPSVTWSTDARPAAARWNGYITYQTSGAGSWGEPADTCTPTLYTNGGNGGFILVTATATTWRSDYYTLGSTYPQCTARSTSSSIYINIVLKNKRSAHLCCDTADNFHSRLWRHSHALRGAHGTRGRRLCRSGWVRRRMLAACARQRCLLPGSAVLHSCSHAHSAAAGREQPPAHDDALTLSRARRSRATRTRARRRSPPTARWASPTPAAPPAPATARVSLAPNDIAV